MQTVIDEHYTREEFKGYSYDPSTTSNFLRQDITSVLGVGSRILLLFTYDGSNLGDRSSYIYKAI